MNDEWLEYARNEREVSNFLKLYDGLPLLEKSPDEVFAMTEAQRRALYEETIQAAEEMGPETKQFALFLPAILEALISAFKELEE